MRHNIIFYIPDDMIRYTYDISAEETLIRGNAIASGDEAYDKEIEDELISRVNNGDIWAWFSFQVKAFLYVYNATIDEYKTFVGKSSWLGCCSYQSYDDFVSDTHQRSGMDEEAFDDLKKVVANYIAQNPLDRIVAVTEM